MSEYIKAKTLKENECFLHTMDFPGGSGVKNPSAMQETQETRVQLLGWEGPLEEVMGADSSILAWRITWTEEPVGNSPWGFKESDATE